MAARYFEGLEHAKLYSKFRISTPLTLSSCVINFLQEKISGSLHTAVDVGCGSGQSTITLASHFTNVVGLDISEAQILEAGKQNSYQNVAFKASTAENLPFEKESVQLVTSGAACHWFDIPKFFQEVDRILVPNGVLAVYYYHFPEIMAKEGSDISNLMHRVYVEDLKGMFAKEVSHFENDYSDIQNLFLYETVREILINEQKTTVSALAGNISTWSGFQIYREVNGNEAAFAIIKKFENTIMDAIDSDKSPEETELTISIKYNLIMGRKSACIF